MKFYLGTHKTSWLATVKIPLFISHNRLKKRKGLPRATCDWALDSGAFSELSAHGRWRTTPQEYLEAALRYREEIGRMNWAAPMDWMCEPHMIERTGLTIEHHQHLTVESFLDLRGHGVAIAPVLQGWSLDDYDRCVDLYASAGVDLRRFIVVGLGTVCRRQATDEIAEIVNGLAQDGIRLHGFGVKISGLAKYGDNLVSSDSMAWSFAARNALYRGRDVQCCKQPTGSCANCLSYALRWRRKVLTNL